MKFKTSDIIGTMNALAIGIISYNYLTGLCKTGSPLGDHLMSIPFLMYSSLNAYASYLVTDTVCDKLKRNKSSEKNKKNLERSL